MFTYLSGVLLVWTASRINHADLTVLAILADPSEHLVLMVPRDGVLNTDSLDSNPLA